MHFSVISDLENSAERLSHKVAITSNNSTISFKELRSKAKATACALIELGIKPGDRVGICMKKSSEQIITILAVLYSNAIFVPILPTLKRQTISHIVTNSGMIAIVTDSIRLNEVSCLKDKVKVLVGNNDLSENYPNLIYLSKKIESKTINPFSRLGIDVAAIIYSSGSTGMPKGIMVSHRNFFDGARITSEYLNTRQTDRIACILSFNFDPEYIFLLV